MTDYIKKASEGDYEDYIEFLTNLVEEEIDNKRVPLREAAEAIVEEAFYQLREQKPILDKLFLKANQVLDPPCQNDMDWKTIRLMRLLKKLDAMKYTCHKKLQPFRIRTGFEKNNKRTITI